MTVLFAFAVRHFFRGSLVSAGRVKKSGALFAAHRATLAGHIPVHRFFYRSMQGQYGFTLMELMVTLAIAAILMAFALPNYSDYVKRGRIVDGLVPLADMGARLEQYFQDHRKYSGACEAGTIAPLPPESNYFKYTCTLSDDAATVTATGKNGMEGFIFTLDTQGVRKTTGTPNGWVQPAANCWATRKDGSC